MAFTGGTIERTRSMSGGASGIARTSALWERLKEHPQRWRSFLARGARGDAPGDLAHAARRGRTTTFVVIVAVAFFGVFFFGVDSTRWLRAATRV